VQISSCAADACRVLIPNAKYKRCHESRRASPCCHSTIHPSCVTRDEVTPHTRFRTLEHVIRYKIRELRSACCRWSFPVLIEKNVYDMSTYHASKKYRQTASISHARIEELWQLLKPFPKCKCWRICGGTYHSRKLDHLHNMLLCIRGTWSGDTGTRGKQGAGSAHNIHGKQHMHESMSTQ
jgi:hypothetical protein